MVTKSLLTSILLGMTAFSTCYAEVKEIAITIDDLPFVGSTNNDPNKLRRENERFMLILQALKDHNVPATGFVIAGSIEKDQWQLLEKFRDDGFVLGNHTYTHKSLNNVSAEKYIDDVDRADSKLAPLMTGQKYFRYPYLAESKGEKKQAVYDYLAQHNYKIAPVTIDSKDYRFNEQLFAIPYRLRPQNLNQIKKRYLGYIWSQTLRAEAKAKKNNGEGSRQILLIHANLLNSHFLGDIIEMYQKNGYKFITLSEALEGTAPSIEKPINDTPKNEDISDMMSLLLESK
ncbi:polysaccharide deacetylase family protein [Legionella dresdenensis]|uniref:Polysaccharide deacetylase family protein n=1 Tax=Legionella dresdenensis TaxID=450200 RepID=A0ABV8CH94_9GAMM